MKTQKLTVMALTTAIALVLSFIESQIPAFVAVPGVKMGLPNIAIVYALYRLGWKEAAMISLIRVVLVSLLFGSAASFLALQPWTILIRLSVRSMPCFLQISTAVGFSSSSLTELSNVSAIIHSPFYKIAIDNLYYNNKLS